jgi:hypothetical protein
MKRIAHAPNHVSAGSSDKEKHGREMQAKSDPKKENRRKSRAEELRLHTHLVIPVCTDWHAL